MSSRESRSRDLSEGPLYFAYRRLSANNQHKETFHSHRGLEILLIHQGKGTMIVNNVSYAIRPGMVCIFQPYQFHHLQLDYSDNQTFERSIAIFEPATFDSYFEKWPALNAFYRNMYLSKLPSPCIYGVEDTHELVTVFQSMQQKVPTLTEAEQLEEISLFLVSAFRSLKPLWQTQRDQITPLRTRKNRHVEQILIWIERHYAMPFHLEDMSKELHLTTYHLSHLFKEAVGISITEYIATRRTHQAVMLLTTTDKPITLIAEEIGITNSSYFCKFFKSRMGTTPHQYRKRWSRTNPPKNKPL
ncbi:AraC family transcriptional regulator [Paenibacillus hamazuiensis]|uniref:AraC family transcriptional regulator n=1 Tax=Paenibacillus hamazuiensis TaxID=2936508 RepID=UPI0023DEDCDF|nr:AraC family transcriptional regulator [Paenibacillus hamazuiensis]